jgi:hypothetical protein
MKPDSIEEILNRLGTEDVPAEASQIAREMSGDFSETLMQPKPHILREYIMKSQITKLAAAAVIILVAMIGLNHFIDSIDGTSVVFAKMAEAIEKESCVHIVLAETHRAGKQFIRELWLILESGNMHEKHPDGTVSFIDSKNRRKYLYSPGAGKIFVIEATDFISTAIRRISIFLRKLHRRTNCFRK